MVYFHFSDLTFANEPFPFFRWQLFTLINKALGIHSTKDTLVYDLQFFVKHCLHKVSYEKLAQTLYETFTPSRVLDFGCGNAFVIEYLNEKGVDVRGIDISPYAYLVANHSLKRAFFIGDVTKPLRLEPADLVISMEVAEHIEPKSSEQYVQNLASHAERYIFFTAASPNQYGVGHINCRPRAFWISLFDKYGFELNLNLTKKIKRKLGAHRAIAAIRYIIDNLLVFERKGSKRINSLKN